MSEKRFEVLFYGDVINCVRDENGKEYNLQELISILMEQQATIESERDLFEKYKASAIRDMRDYSDKIIEMQKKVDEQQAEIERLQKILTLHNIS